MKIGGVYILSRRSIARMLATITAALMMFYVAATAKAEAIVHRIHDATVALVSLDRQMIGRLARTVVPDFMYLEYKSLYLELKPSVAAASATPPGTVAHRDGHLARCGRPLGEATLMSLPALARPLSEAARAPLPRMAAAAPVTKADLRTAVKTILRGEDVNAAKPGPRLTAAKRRQIEAAEAYRKSHAGCTLHNACMRSFVPAKGGYKSAKTLYRVIVRL